VYDATFGRALSLGTIKSKVMVEFLPADDRQIMEAKSSAATFKNMIRVTDLVLLFYFYTFIIQIITYCF
jgi:hypothetical protein